MLYNRLNYTEIVFEDVSLVEQHLKVHHDLVTRLYRDQNHATRQEEHLDHESVHSYLPQRGGFSNAQAARHETPGYQDAPSTPTNICLPTSDQTSQEITADPHDSSLSGVAPSRNGTHVYQNSSRPVNHAEERTRLHISDFIQSLSE